MTVALLYMRDLDSAGHAIISVLNSNVCPQARFPFLDEDVVSALLDLPLWDIVDLQQPVGCGDKKILREVSVSAHT